MSIGRCKLPRKCSDCIVARSDGARVSRLSHCHYNDCAWLSKSQTRLEDKIAIHYRIGSTVTPPPAWVGLWPSHTSTSDNPDRDNNFIIPIHCSLRRQITYVNEFIWNQLSTMKNEFSCANCKSWWVNQILHLTFHKNSCNYNSIYATTLYALWRFYPILIRVFVWYIRKYFINIVVTFRVKVQWCYRK